MPRKFGFLFLALAVLWASSAAAEGRISVAVVLEGGLGDLSFNDIINKGFEKARGELGINGEIMECNFDPGKYSSYLAEAAEKSDLVLVQGPNVMNALAEIAPKFPDTDFAVLDTPGEMGHVTFAYVRQNEGSFLAGALAAMMTTREGDFRVNSEATIGVVCGEDIPVMYSFIAGYEQGARYINPGIKILRDFAGSWDDPVKGSEITRNQHKNGADVVFQVAGGTGKGIIAAAKEGNFYAIGVDSPQEYLAPEAVLTSVLKRFDVITYDLIREKKEGSYKRGVNLSYGLKEGGVGLSWSASSLVLVPKEVRVRLDALESDIVAGRIKVDETIKGHE